MAPERPRNAGPQTEDGFIQLALELAGAIGVAGFTDTELAVLTWVLAQAYGPRKNELVILSPARLSAITDIERKNLAHAIRSLESRNVLHRAARNTFQFNKHHGDWVCRRPDRVARVARAMTDAYGFRRRPENPDASTKVGGVTEPPLGV